MVTLRRHAILIAAAVSLFVLAVGATAVVGSAASPTDDARTTYHQVITDHDAVVSARAAAERSPFDLRQAPVRVLVAWFWLLVVAALLVRTAGRTIELRTRRSGSVEAARPRSNRGPPAPSFA